MRNQRIFKLVQSGQRDGFQYVYSIDSNDRVDLRIINEDGSTSTFKEISLKDCERIIENRAKIGMAVF